MKAIFSIALLLSFGIAAAAEKSAVEEHSQAEVLLFETNHLSQIKQPEVLYYTFEKQGSLEEGFEDTVRIKVEKVKPDGFKTVSTDYLTGDNRKEFATLEQAQGNPVLLFFLERDIHEMQRLTKGHWRYFQKGIRTALAENAEVRTVSFLYNGKETAGHEIKITPYTSDPHKSRFEKFAEKSYVFALSDAVPGGIYQIRTVVPDPDAKEPLLEETLTFRKEEEK